ncbi:undecaprenyl-diphosphatase UppP [bacterium]|nr:undecaprenyl-diphosphatase UppP [bacterium]
MFFLEAIVLGVVQGLTEFLPISSSAHLTLLPKIFGWEAELLNSLAFDVALHFGTLLAVVVYFWKDLKTILGAWILSLYQPGMRSDKNVRLGWFIIIGTIPAVIAALVLKESIETTFRAPWIIGAWLVGFGLVMAGAEAATRKEREVGSMKWGEALFVGFAQALALMPGVSRSGSTIAAGMLLRFRRDEAARFSFLLGMPAIFGAVVFNLPDLAAAAIDQSLVTLLVGMLAAAVTGYGCIKFLLAYLRKRTLYIFVVYRVVLGIGIIIWALRAGH